MRLLLVLLFSFAVVGVSAQDVITKRRGTVKLYFEDGKLKAKGKVKNYKRRGTWKYYDHEGNLVVVADFTNDSINGAYKEYHPGAGIMYDGTYCMNYKCGQWKTYDRDGKLIAQENFRKGQADGLQRFWYPNGQLRDSVFYDNGVIQSAYMWYANGNRKAITPYRNGLPEGTWLEYPEEPVDTFPLLRQEYHDGKLNGWSYFYSGKDLMRKVNYSNGLRHGSDISYLDGAVSSIENYEEGEREGFSEHFHHRQLIMRMHWKDGLKHGATEEYNRDGHIMYMTWYTAGVFDSSRAYYNNGRTAVRKTPTEEMGLYFIQQWDSAGTLLATGFVDHNSQRDSSWTTYFPSGKVRSVTNYDHGALRGVFTKYYSNGKKMIEMVFLADGRNTPPDVFYENGKRVPMHTHYYSEVVQGNKPGEILIDESQFQREIIDRIFDTGN